QFNRDQLSIDDDWSVGKVFTKEISLPSSTDNLTARRNIKYYSLKIIMT
ncbi:11030_t:CDS:1, partial [Gigaspora rosea]